MNENLVINLYYQPTNAAQTRELIDWIEGGNKHRGAGDIAAETVEIMMGIYESARQNRLIKFPMEEKGYPLEEMIKEVMKTTKEKFVELDSKIKLVNQKIDLIIKNHLHHMKQDIDRILYGLGAVGLLVLGQLLYILTK